MILIRILKIYGSKFIEIKSPNMAVQLTRATAAYRKTKISTNSVVFGIFCGVALSTDLGVGHHELKGHNERTKYSRTRTGS